jgi:hypothetical protein
MLTFLKKLTLISFLFCFVLLGIYYFLFSTTNLQDEDVTPPPLKKSEKKKTSILGTQVKNVGTNAVEDFYKDSSGSLPVDPDFDSDPGEICGNGKSFYYTSKPPKKPVPEGWVTPPLPGADPEYVGPAPEDPFKESPYAMPSSKRVLARPAIMDLKEPIFIDEVVKVVRNSTQKIALVSESDLDPSLMTLKERVVPLKRSRLHTKDDVGLASELKKTGIEFILIDKTRPEVSPWIEEKFSYMHIRLRDGLETDWFHPVVIGSGFNLYRIAPPFTLSKKEKNDLSKYARKLLNGEESSPPSLNPSKKALGASYYRAIVSLRKRDVPGLKGRKLVKRISKGKSVSEAIKVSSEKIRKDWNKIIGSNSKAVSVNSLPKSISEALDTMEIEIELIYDMAIITDRKVHNLVWNLELGLHGALVWKNKELHYLEPSYAVQMESKSPVQFLEQTLKKRKLKEFLRKPKKKSNYWRKAVLHESAWERDQNIRFGRFRTFHWVEENNKERNIVELYRGVPLRKMEEVTKDSLVNSLVLGASWLMKHQTPDGQYAYKYTPTNKPEKRWEAGGNIVRHALNPYTLLMVNKITPDPAYVESAKRGIEFTLTFLREKDGRCVVCHRDTPARYYNAKIGTVAVTILSILKLGEIADISEYHEVLKCFGEALLYMQDKNGHYRQYDVPVDHPYYGAESTIAPGEIIFALSRMYTYFKDERYKASIDLALPWYIKAWRLLQKQTTKEGIYNEEDRTNLIGIVPWLVTAMNDLYLSTKDEKYADLAFEQQDWIDDTFFYYPDRSRYPDYVGASFKIHWELPAINSCQYAEGAAAAYNLGRHTNKKDLDRMREVVMESMRFCLQLQFDSYGSTYFTPIPEEVMGGYRYTLGHLRLRNDYSYHAMAAIAQAVEYLREDDFDG